MTNPTLPAPSRPRIVRQNRGAPDYHPGPSRRSWPPARPPAAVLRSTLNAPSGDKFNLELRDSPRWPTEASGIPLPGYHPPVENLRELAGTAAPSRTTTPKWFFLENCVEPPRAQRAGRGHPLNNAGNFSSWRVRRQGASSELAVGGRLNEPTDRPTDRLTWLARI